MASSVPNRARNRRAWTEFGDLVADLEEDYAAAKASGLSGPVFDELKQTMSAERRAYRLLGEELGLRGGIAIELPMWKVWFEIACGHEMDARALYSKIVGGTGNLYEEFTQALVAVTSAAFSVEALSGEILYRVAEDPRTAKGKRPNRDQRIRYLLKTAFDPPRSDLDKLMVRVAQTFRLRDFATHAYTQTLPTEPHPSGVNSGIDNAYINAVTAAAAVDTARDVVRLARDQSASTRSVGRWQVSRKNYFDAVEQAEASRAATPQPQPVPGWDLPSGARPTD